jgi:hypothetical protein
MDPSNSYHPTDNALPAQEADVSPPLSNSGTTITTTSSQPQNQDPQQQQQQEQSQPESSQWWSQYQKNRKTLGKEKKVFCQVPTCCLDLSSKNYKDYHRRYRICPEHCSAIEVDIEAVKLRFCQQCAFFHTLDMYDDNKKSCREMLERIRQRRAATKDKRKREDAEDCAKAAARASDEDEDEAGVQIV